MLRSDSLAAQIPVSALLQASLGDAFQVEEPHHVGEQPPLGVHPLGVGLEVNPTDPQFPHPLGGLRVEVVDQFHARFPALHRLDQVRHGPAKNRGEFAGHIERAAQASDVVAGE